MKRFFFFLFLLIVPALHAQAQTCSVTGTLRGTDYSPIPYGRVTVVRVVKSSLFTIDTPKQYSANSSGAITLTVPCSSSFWLSGNHWALNSYGSAGRRLSIGATDSTLENLIAAAASVFTTLGDFVYGGTDGAPARLAGNTSTTPKALFSVGTGAAAQAPALYSLLGSGSLGITLDNTAKTATFSYSPSSGDLLSAFGSQSANRVMAGPTTGSAASPTFRALVAADIPDLSATYLPLTGGTLTGNLTLSGAPSNNLHAATKAYVDSAVAGAGVGSTSSGAIPYNNAGTLATSPLSRVDSTTVQVAAINGGSAANDDLTLQGTSNSTRTTSYLNLQPSGGLVGIGLTTPQAQLHIDKPSAGYRTYQAIQLETGDATGGSDFGFVVSTNAGSNGATRQHNQMSWGYNCSGPNITAGDHTLCQSIESFWRTPTLINQIEYYFSYSNAAGTNGYRPWGMNINLDTDVSDIQFNVETTAWQNRADGTENMSITNGSDVAQINLKKTSSIVFSGTQTNAITNSGTTLVYANLTRSGGGNLYGFAGGGSSVTNEVNFFGAQGDATVANDMILSLGQVSPAARNRALRWNGTTGRWEFETTSTTFQPMISANLTAGRIPFGDGTVTLASDSNLTYNDASDYLVLAGSTKLGIGTATPLSPIHILSNNQDGLRIQRTTSTARAYEFYVANDGHFSFYDLTAGADRLILTSGGLFGFDTGADVLTAKVSVNGSLAAGTYRTATSNGFAVSGSAGIGTNNPAAKLEVTGSIYANATASNTVFSGTPGTNNANLIGSSGYWALRTNTSNAFNLDVYNGGSPLAAITINQSGQLGVNTSPSTLLDVNNAIRADASSTADDTRFWLWDVTAGAFKRVVRGAADSCGTGFRCLRIAN